MKRKLLLGIVASAGTVGLITFAVWPKPKPHVKVVLRKPFKQIGTIAERRKDTEKTVESLKSNSSPEAQDKVGMAEMQLAYFDAGAKDYEASRKRFLAVTKIKGTGQMNADFGGINDGAAYQAAVCLVAEHKEKEAQTAFRSFMTDYQLSPLVFAAEKRLVRLNGGKPDPQDEKLLQSAVTAQETKAKYESALCGPKTIAYMLNNGLLRAADREAGGTNNSRGSAAAHNVATSDNLSSKPQETVVGVPSPSESATRERERVRENSGSETKKSDLTHEIATDCGTTDKGTTIDGLRKGLRKMGYESYGLDLNRQDFQKLPLPAILLDGDHYFAILERKGDKIVLFDTLLNAKREVPLPKEDDPTFRATVIAFHLGQLQESPLTGGAPPKPEHAVPDKSQPTKPVRPSGT